MWSYCGKSIFQRLSMAIKKKYELSNGECAYCSANACDLKKCARCGLVCYCSKACQLAHWISEPFGHRDRCVAPKDRKLPTLEPEETHVGRTLSENFEEGLCGICFEKLLAEWHEDMSQQSGALHAGTQTLVCEHSFHLKCTSDLASSVSIPQCPLCRGPCSSMLVETLICSVTIIAHCR